MRFSPGCCRCGVTIGTITVSCCAKKVAETLYLHLLGCTAGSCYEGKERQYDYDAAFTSHHRWVNAGGADSCGTDTFAWGALNTHANYSAACFGVGQNPLDDAGGVSVCNNCGDAEVEFAAWVRFVWLGGAGLVPYFGVFTSYSGDFQQGSLSGSDVVVPDIDGGLTLPATLQFDYTGATPPFNITWDDTQRCWIGTDGVGTEHRVYATRMRNETTGQRDVTAFFAVVSPCSCAGGVSGPGTSGVCNTISTSCDSARKSTSTTSPLLLDFVSIGALVYP